MTVSSPLCHASNAEYNYKKRATKRCRFSYRLNGQRRGSSFYFFSSADAVRLYTPTIQTLNLFLGRAQIEPEEMSGESSDGCTPLDASKFQHTPYYCEENVYLLCKSLCQSGIADATGSDLFVVFISNEKKQVPLWHQKASGRADGIVLWDYHVICVQRKKGIESQPLVWDLDSTLPFPSTLASYVAETIQPSFQLFSDYQRFFRVVHAPLFLKNFASDRRHMKDPDGNWTAQPPQYATIVAQDGTLHNLNEYIAMSSTDTLSSLDHDLVRAVTTQKLGVVVSHIQLQELFSKLLP